MGTSNGIIVHKAGEICGIHVVVTSPEGRPDLFQVEMLNTYDGMAEVGEQFVGAPKKAQAVITSEIILSALDTASVTWDVADDGAPHGNALSCLMEAYLAAKAEIDSSDDMSDEQAEEFIAKVMEPARAAIMACNEPVARHSDILSALMVMQADQEAGPSDLTSHLIEASLRFYGQA
jgi:hypothetical protein